jgi:lipoic acid synthetase
MQNNISKALLRKKFATIESPVKPEWIKVKIQTDKINQIKKTLKSNRIVTVCEEAMCPNMSDCWAKSHATFMILGDICTRACSFCNISTGKPNQVDHTEPVRVANSVKKLNLSHVVITSVDRDDLKDGGAQHFSDTINEIKLKCPDTTIEVLTPDFRNKINSIDLLSKCQIDVFNHNLETVKSLYKSVRPGANYNHSLSILSKIKRLNAKLFTKSGIMIGLGEKFSEIMELMDDLRHNNVDFITIGQYLRPTKNHHPVIEYHSPDYFRKLYDEAIRRGFKIVSSSPFTRSSYHAEDDFKKLKYITLNA